MAIDWEAYRKKAKKRDAYEYQKNIMNNDIAPVRTTTTLSGDDIAPVTTTKKSLFDDGYDFGDITKTILNSRKTNAQETNNIGPVTAQEDKYSKLTLKEIEDEISRLQGEKKAYAEKYGNKVTLMASSAAEKILGGFTNALGIGNDVDLSDSKTGVDKLNDYQAEIETLQTYQLKKAIEEKYKVLDEETLSEVEALSGFIGEGQIKGVFDLLGIESGGETEEEKSARKSLKKKGYSDDEIAELVELHNRQKQSGINREYEKVMEDFGSKHPVAQIGQSAFTDIFGSFGGTLSEAQQYIKKLQGEGSKYGINTDDIYHGITRGNIAADTKAKADHNWIIETPTGQELDAFDIVFDIGSGVADNVARMVVGGGNSSISGAMMGSQVFNQSVIEGKEKGYSDEKALTIGLLQASIESLTEKYSVETILGDSGGIARKLAKSFVAEGSEGVTSDWLNRILDVIANGNHSETMKSYNSYIEDGYSENDALVQMIYEIGGESLKTFLLEGTTGFILGGGVSLVNIAQQKTSTQSEKNTVNKLTENERKVVDVEYKNRIAESESNGKPLNKREKNKIYNDVLKDLDKGYISIDTIESALGGETHDNYEVRNLVKDSRLAESYNELDKKGQSYEADLSQYKGKAKEYVQEIMESNVGNNTRKFHDAVDLAAKLYADKGLKVKFATNEQIIQAIKEAEGDNYNAEAHEGKMHHGFISSDRKTVYVNIKSARYLNTTVGHELTHSMEKANTYDELKSFVLKFAKAKYKDDFENLYKKYEEDYKGVYANDSDFQNKIEQEIVADIVGQYVFTDAEFINKLSTEKPNIFKRIYDEIKYLCKIATAGSKEARKLEKVKREFDKAYKESGKAKGDTKYSLDMVEKVEPTSNKWHRTLTTEEAKARFPKLWDVTADESEVRNPTQISSTVKTYRRVYDYLQSEGFDGTILDASSGLGYGTKAGIEEYGFNVEDIEPYPDKSYNPKYRDYSTLNKKYDVVISNAVLNVLPQDQRDALVIKMGELLNDGGRMFVSTRGRDVDSLGTNEKNTKISPMEWYVDSTGSYQKGFTKPELVAYLKDALGDGYTVEPTNLVSGTAAIVTKDGEKFAQENDIRYSLSNSEGRNLTKEQAEYFKDSKVRDAEGNLIPVYHGTFEDFTVFDINKTANANIFGKGHYFTNSEKDARNNYATLEGADVKTKIESLAYSYFEEMGYTEEDLYDNDHIDEWNEAYDRAEAFYESGKVMQVYLNITNPVYADKYQSLYDKEGNFVSARSIEGLKELGFDGIIDYHASEKFDFQHLEEETAHYVVFDSNQIKNVDNLKPTEDADIRYSLSETDNKYLSAVENGDTETAQKMVEEAAKKAGYNSPKLYHGTKGFGFTKIKTSGVETGVEWSPFFAASREDISASYVPYGKTRAISQEMDYDYIEDMLEEKKEEMSDLISDFRGLIDRRISEWFFGQQDNSYLENLVENANYEAGEGDGVYDVLIDIVYDAFYEYHDDYFAEYEDADEWIENSSEGQEIVGKILEIEGEKSAIHELEFGDELGGIYELYANLSNMFIVDANGVAWNELRPEGLPKIERYGHKDAPYKTRDVALWARENGYDGVIFKNIKDNGAYGRTPMGDVYTFFRPESQVKSADPVTYDDNGNVIPLSQRFNEGNNDIRYSLTEQEAQETNDKLNKVGFNYDVKSETISYSLSSLEDAFNYKTDENGLLVDEDDYLKARNEYVDALAKSIAMEKGKPTREEYKKADRYLDSLFLVHDMIAADKDRLDYEAAVKRSAWVGNVEYGGSIDFSTLCAKRRLFTGTFDAIQNELPDTVLTDKDFLNIRNLLLEHGEESPCSMCYVEGSRAKHGIYVNKWLKEYLKTNPEWKPQIADFTSTTRLEQTRIQHPEAYKEYVKAMNKLSQRKPKEASVRTDYQGEILDAFSNDSSVETKNKNGGIRFNSFSDFEIIHALDCMQVLTDMSRVGLNGQAYTKVKEFAESFGNTGLKINLSLVAKDVDANGKLIMDETNGMNYAEAMDIRNRYSENVGTVIVVFNDEQLKSALADNTIDFVLPFHRSQWRKSQYALMGLPEVTRDYTNIQNDRYTNPKTNRPKKAPNGNIMPNEYWDFTLSGRENAQKYLDYINENAYIPKFDFLLDKVDGKWVLPNGAVGDGYFKLLIDFKMYNNDGVGSPQKPVLPEFNMPYIQQMLNDYVGGHQAFPVAHDVVDKFVEGKKNGKFSLSKEGEHPTRDYRYGNLYISGDDVRYQPTEDIAPTVSDVEKVAPVDVAKNTTTTFDDIAPMTEAEAKAMRNDVPIDDGEIAPPVKSSKWNGDIEQPIAKVLTKEPEVKKKSKLWSKIKTNFIDKASPFETLALKTGNREVDAKFNSIRYADSKAQTLIGEGAEGVKALNDIQAEVENDGLTQSLYEYLYHKHNVDRMTLADRYDSVPNKAVFGNNVTAKESQEIVNQYESAEPKLKEYAQEIYNYNKHLRNLLVDGGVISQETADLWEEMYPHYVPIRRVGDEGLNINVALDTGRTGINAPIKRATGGNRDILPLFDTMAQRTLQTYKAIAKNRFGIELKNTLGTTIESTETSLDEVIDSIDTQDSLLQEGKNGRNPTFTVFENGEKVTFEITEEMYDAMKPTSEGLAYTNKVANTVSNAMRGVLTEYNPTFMLTNAIKDAQDVFINSQHPARTYKNFPKTIKELTTKGKWYTEYMQNGGADNTYFDKQTNSFNKEKSELSKVIGFPLEKISEANNFIERIPRLAEYIASREMGRSIDVSMLDAARVTTNFSAGGDVTKFLNRNGATFLNASVQGATQQVRNIREAKANGLKGWVQLATKVALAGLPVLFLNGLLWDDDEEYEDLSDYVKQNYYVVAKMQDGKFVRIPKGRAMAVIQEAFTQVHNALTGDDEVDLQNFLELAVSNLAPNNPLDNNIIAPIKQVIENKTWYGEDLVPTRLQDVPGAEQYDESTDAISKWLGEKLNYSPYKINYLLDQYSGGLGDVVLPMLTPKAESGDNSMIGFLGAPMRDKFSTDSVFNNQNTADFYNVSDELKVNANSSNATDEDVLKSKYFNSISTEISDMYKEKREIQNSNLSDAVKYKQVRDIQEQINQITENALNTYENVKINGSYANIGDRHYRLNDDGEWQKITDEQLEKQNEVIGILGITPSQYWGNKAEYDMKAFYPEKYKVLQEQGISVEDYKENYEKSAFLYTDDYSWAANNPGKYTLSKVITDDVMEYRQYTSDLYNIKADKDSNGKSISGSRKKKVVAYINSLDIEDGAKYVLWKSQYPADKTYNKAIFEYINGRSDITRDEKITILEELGAKVDSNGNVRW